MLHPKIYIFTLLAALFFNPFCTATGPIIKNNSSNTVNTVISEKDIVIISVSRNDKAYYEGNLYSTINQQYTNYRIIWVDDASTDGTPDLVEAYLKKNDPTGKVTLVKNTTRCGSMENIYNAVHSCKDHEIMVMVEGDDQLAHSKVLQIVNKTYQDPNVWMSYGNYQSLYPCSAHFSRQVPADVIAKNAFRETEWTTSHTRIYYAWLFKKIKREDFMYKGNFYPFVSDLVAMFPMLEMAGTHSKFIPDVLYIYNNNSPFNEFRVAPEGTLVCDAAIRSAQKYTPLDAAPIFITA